MNILLVLAFLFYIGSMLGWVLELFFRRIISKTGKWINPGFLVGPYLPLYGFGLCILFLMASGEAYFPPIPDYLKKLLLFILMAVMMTAIEYIAGIIFIKHMKVELWNYNNEWGNIDGIICPKYSLFWAILGAMYYFFIHPHILSALAWLSDNLAFSFFVGMFYGFFIIDFVYSAQLLVKIRQFAKDNEIVVRFEELKLNIIQFAEEKKKKRKHFRFFFSLSPDIPLSEHLGRYHEAKKRLEDDIKNMIKKK